MRRLHLVAESGSVRMERRADIKETCLLLLEMTLDTIVLVVMVNMNHGDCNGVTKYMVMIMRISTHPEKSLL